MVHLEELHIKNMKVRTLAMATLLLDNLPSLKKASNWFLDLYGDDMVSFKKHLKKYKERGLKLEYKEWWILQMLLSIKCIGCFKLVLC